MFNYYFYMIEKYIISFIKSVQLFSIIIDIISNFTKFYQFVNSIIYNYYLIDKSSFVTFFASFSTKKENPHLISLYLNP